jgi:hypothetical protein
MAALKFLEWPAGLWYRAAFFKADWCRKMARPAFIESESFPQSKSDSTLEL